VTAGEGVDDARLGRRQRRRFAAHFAPVALALLCVSVLFAGDDGAAGAVGMVALAQGIGLAVAAAWPAAGHNPLSER
jgi:hypothetical protein